MARSALRDIPIVNRIRQAALSGGNAVIVKNSQDVTATIYSAASGTTTLTNSFNLATYQHSGLPGFREPGSYKLTCGGAVEQVFSTEGYDEVLGLYPSDDLLSVSNTCPQFCIPSVSATMTDQVVKFVRIVPDKKITAASIVLYSGTAAA